jgi:hypothetical protein
MDKTGYTEMGRFSSGSGASATHYDLVNMSIQNDTDFTARVVILAHRNHDLDEHRVLVSRRSTSNTHCRKGEVVVVVFNADNDSFYGGYVLNVGGDFTFPIT